MINRQNMLEEQLLRENIRKAIQIVKEKHNKNENYVRTIVRHLVKEGSPSVKYEYTALNLLAHFIKEKGFVEDEPEEVEEEPEEDEVINVSIGDLEDNGGDLTPAEEEEEEFTLGEDGEGIEIEEEEPDSGIKIYSREAYKRVGPSLRRYYGQIEKDSMLKKAVEIDGKEYQPGELSERDLFQIYFKKNIVLWAGRYEEEFFGTTPETEIDIEGAEEELETGVDDMGLGDEEGFEEEGEEEIDLGL